MNVIIAMLIFFITIMILMACLLFFLSKKRKELFTIIDHKTKICKKCGSMYVYERGKGWINMEVKDINCECMIYK